MNLNRRRFFRAAALLPAAALQTKALTNSQRAQILRDHEADLAAPGAVEYVEDPSIELFVRLEELDPDDPGQLSGAKLSICESGECVVVTPVIGDILQRDGSRTSHGLGFMQGYEVLRLASFDLEGGGFDLVFFRADSDRPEAANSVYVKLNSGELPELQLYAGRHCLGVLRGDLMLRFFDCLRMRCEMESPR